MEIASQVEELETEETVDANYESLDTILHFFDVCDKTCELEKSDIRITQNDIQNYEEQKLQQIQKKIQFSQAKHKKAAKLNINQNGLQALEQEQLQRLVNKKSKVFSPINKKASLRQVQRQVLSSKTVTDFWLKLDKIEENVDLSAQEKSESQDKSKDEDNYFWENESNSTNESQIDIQINNQMTQMERQNTTRILDECRFNCKKNYHSDITIQLQSKKQLEQAKLNEKIEKSKQLNF